MVSRYHLAFTLFAEETSTQVEVAFIEALEADGKDWLLEDPDFAEALASGHVPDNDERVPVLCAVLRQRPPDDLLPDRPVHGHRPHRPTLRPSRHPQRPSLDRVVLRPPQSREPHLDAIADPAEMTRELQALKTRYNTVRLHEAIGYVTPDDEHHGRGPALRKARADQLAKARAHRIATRRAQMRDNQPNTQTTNGEN